MVMTHKMASIALSTVLVLCGIAAISFPYRAEAAMHTAAMQVYDNGTVAVHAQSKVPVSKKALKWLKGKWYTVGMGTNPGKPRSMVKFTKKYRKTYQYNGTKWKLIGKDRIKKVKKTKAGYNVYLKNGGMYKARGKGLDSYYKSDGEWRLSGTSSLHR